jgi:hypothetical protein
LIAYLDTSAFVPLIVQEPGSASCRRIWNDADVVISSRLLYVETTAALAQARRMKRLTLRTHRASNALLERLWPELDVIEVDETMMRRAAALADEFGLRGYDAVHCASIEQLDDADVVGAAGDRQILQAWSALGIATFDSNRP